MNVFLLTYGPKIKAGWGLIGIVGVLSHPLLVEAKQGIPVMTH